MSTPRFYSWDDDGSPGRALSGNMQNRLKQILIPCLVTGYGSKPGAGWTVGHEHANGFSLSNGDAYINFVSDLPAEGAYPAMYPWAIQVYVAESLQDGSKAVMSGLNLCSGPYRHGEPEGSGYPRQIFNGYQSIEANISTLQWTVVADEKTVIISCSTSNCAYDLNSQFSLYFGNIFSDVGIFSRFAVFGGDVSSFNSSGYTKTLAGGYTTPRDLRTGLVGSASAVTEPFQRNRDSAPYSNIGGNIPYNINLQPPRVFSVDAFVGRLRGVVYDDVLSAYGWPLYLRALGLSATDIQGRNKIITIGVNKYAYAPGYNGGFLMTNDPVFW